ncbi:UDP-N-acetylmuramoyl-L-alanyl-D-glutamate--2,6-diaminopimelate ligase [Chitinasiproducens palmae]|uniref:UDP-N-acetylmuramoyl-L-alanyl-D-glutamate--2,6-diaminopimelate ligase n=1 Tax=Chitinasiproducens palmae TaxID=1770053 RepID=A0A1H2PRS9_9BURK|nr:UDP-N-acetylmuramoyl-L-alanyl-D-glutamate--2,6-diaminopimelate ligase [Chitinasiproducens palmae]SDV49595.1 UDP-N-acetylmuramoylalanyl-D-glutamate--2,6-diaminopimelate ligase [Chitinasiproducens palmae]
MTHASLRPDGVAAALQWLRERVTPQADLHVDSRDIRTGDVFLAYAVDGADSRPHAADAVARGAAAVLWQSDRGPVGAPPSTVPVLTLDGLDALAGPLASAWYDAPSETLDTVGITGTNGKTSCSFWIAHALNACARRCAVIGTLGSGFPERPVATGFTTPDAARLQRALRDLVRQGAQAVAMEVSSHALHQGRVNGVAFDVAVFTNLTQDHLDYHGDFAAYEAAKARLFDWPGLRAAVINADDEAGRRLLARLSARTDARVPVIAYGLADAGQIEPAGTGHSGASALRTLIARNLRPTARGTAFDIDGSWGTRAIEVPTFGAFNVSNLLAVVGALLGLGVAWDDALASLPALPAVRGRMERLGGRERADEPLLIVDFAHTPDGLAQTLSALRPLADARGGRLVVAFGCGGDRDPGKRPQMGRIAATLADAVVLTSDNPRSEAPSAIIDQIAAGVPASAAARVRAIEDRASAILQTVRSARVEDVVVLAGKGHESTQEIAGKKRPFSDHDHALLALAARATQAAPPGNLGNPGNAEGATR